MMDPFEIICVVLTTVGITLMVVLVVVRLVGFCATMRRRLARGSGTTHADVEDDGHGAGLSAGELVGLPCHDFKSADADGGAARDCAICLEEFEAGDRCRKLPRCEHSFHAECVDSWLRKSSACPVCRADVVVRPLKGEAKAAASAGAVEMAERRSLSAALEIVIVTGR